MLDLRVESGYLCVTVLPYAALKLPRERHLKSREALRRGLESTSYPITLRTPWEFEGAALTPDLIDYLKGTQCHYDPVLPVAILGQKRYDALVRWQWQGKPMNKL